MHFLSSISLYCDIEKLIICIINWCKGKTLLVSLKGRNAFWYKINHSKILILVLTLDQRNKVSCGAQLNCGYFPNDTGFLRPEHSEMKLRIAATGFPPSSGEMDPSHRVSHLTLPAPRNTSTESLLPFKRSILREWQETKARGENVLSMRLCKCVRLCSILGVNGSTGDID